jgi:hypothetical protein
VLLVGSQQHKLPPAVITPAEQQQEQKENQELKTKRNLLLSTLNNKGVFLELNYKEGMKM